MDREMWISFREILTMLRKETLEGVRTQEKLRKIAQDMHEPSRNLPVAAIK